MTSHTVTHPPAHTRRCPTATLSLPTSPPTGGGTTSRCGTSLPPMQQGSFSSRLTRSHSAPRNAHPNTATRDRGGAGRGWRLLSKGTAVRRAALVYTNKEKPSTTRESSHNKHIERRRGPHASPRPPVGPPSEVSPRTHTHTPALPLATSRSQETKWWWWTAGRQDTHVKSGRKTAQCSQPAGHAASPRRLTHAVARQQRHGPPPRHELNLHAPRRGKGNEKATQATRETSHEVQKHKRYETPLHREQGWGGGVLCSKGYAERSRNS